MAPLVYFVRHGETAWNAEFRLQGQADTDMTANGRAQAARNGRKLAELIDNPADFDFVSSPLKRTRETMELVRAGMKLPPADYSLDPRLIEVHFGDWQGFTMAELEARYPGSTAVRLFDKWGCVPPGTGAESYAMLLARVRPWFEALSRPTVCVTHGGVIRTIFRLAANMPANEAAALDVAQDRVLRLEDSRLEWL
jgi:probable phosphoglycerate mutase